MKKLLLLLAFAMPVMGRETVMPEDGQWNYVSIMGQSGEPKYEALKAALGHDPKLVDLQNHAHVAVLPAEGGIYQGRYASTVQALPCVRVQSADGTILFQASGEKAPTTAKALAEAVCPLCPNKPNPTPPGPVPPSVTPSPILDTPAPGPLPLDDDLLKYGVAMLGGFGVGGYEFWKSKFGTKGGA